jgi:periplasmic copper chaperone A
MSTNRFKRAGVVLGVTAVTGAAMLLGSGVASAHVTAKVLGETAAAGGYAKITFRVPNEDDKAGTVKLEIKLPADAPMSSVRPKAVPGWTAKVVKSKLDKPIESHGTEILEAASSVTWTANPGVRIAPGEFAEFELSVGPLPEVEQLILPTVQTYEGNKTVAWNEDPPAEGAEEPEHPAPVVALSPAAEEDGETAAPAANQEPAETADKATISADSTDDTARWLGGAGLVVGALGLGFGVGATMRARRAGGVKS